MLVLRRLRRVAARNLEKLVVGSYLALYFAPPEILSRLPPLLRDSTAEITYHLGFSFLFYLTLFKRSEKLRNSSLSILLVLGISLIFEVLQIFVGRDFEIKDFLLDSLGGGFALGILKLLDRLNS